MQVPEQVSEGDDEVPALGHGETEQPGQLFEGDEHGGPGRKAEQNGAGDEIQQVAQSGRAHDNLDESGEARQSEGQFDVHRRPAGGQIGQGTEDHQGDGRGGAGDQVGRTAPKAGGQGGDDGGVEAILHRQAGDEGVGHGLGQGHHRHRQTGEQVRLEVGPPVAAESRRGRGPDQ